MPRKKKKKKKIQQIIQIKTNEAGLKKLLVCCHPTLGLRVGSVGWDFFTLEKVSFVSRALPLFDISLVAEKKPFMRDYRYNK